MMNETKEMRDARRQLQTLSASDPAASANMLRNVAAHSIMITGRLGRHRCGREPQIGAGFLLTESEGRLCGAAARKSRTDYVFIGFDIDDAAGPCVGLGVFRKEGDTMMLYGDCDLWSPANDGQAVIVPRGDGYIGHFAFRQGKPFEFVEGPLPGEYDAGVRRAGRRMERLIASDDLRNIHSEGYMHHIFNEDQDVFADTTRAAA